MAKYIISIDQSTQGTKALLFDETGSIMRRTDRPHRQIINEKGWVSHDPEEIYSNVLEVVKELLEGVEKEYVVGLGISNQRETSLAWNRVTGKPYGNAVVWQCARAVDICARVEKAGAAELIRQKTGMNLSPYFPASKIAWLLENEEGAKAAAERHEICLVKHFDYNFLRNAFRKVLLERLTSRIGPAFRKVKNEMYTKHADGFYVRAKPNLCTPDITIKYISRYLGRPVIATSRIDTYDGENVTFHYTRHEDNKTVTETIPALNFIQKLIVHIPEKHFKMLRYYGIYAKHHKQEKKLRKCISAEKQRFLRSIQDWRQSILLSFGYNPLCCSKCGTSMLVLEVYHKKNFINNVMANPTHSLFCHVIFYFQFIIHHF